MHHTFADGTEYKHRLVRCMLLQDRIQSIIKSSIEHKIIDAVLALMSIHKARQFAWTKFFAKLKVVRGMLDRVMFLPQAGTVPL